MPVRARMFVQTVSHHAGETATVQLAAVSRGKENTEWSQYTPGGNVSLSLSRKASGALAFFKERLGKEVLVDFSDAPDPVCTQCNQYIAKGEGTEVRGVDGYVAGEYVHTDPERGCFVNARKRLGLDG